MSQPMNDEILNMLIDMRDRGMIEDSTKLSLLAEVIRLREIVSKLPAATEAARQGRGRAQNYLNGLEPGASHIWHMILALRMDFDGCLSGLESAALAAREKKK